MAKLRLRPFQHQLGLRQGCCYGGYRREKLSRCLSLDLCLASALIAMSCLLDDSEADKQWRIVYRIDPDAIVIADVFQKTTQKTPKRVIENCQRRLKLYDEISGVT